jgi:uncharacterized protein
VLRKSIPLQLKDIDGKQGIVAFYFAHFGSVDMENDLIEKGAYKKTIAENRNRIKHFKNHDPLQVPGVIQELGEDETGAFAVSKLMPTTLGKDTLIEYEHKAITEHSQGFQTIKQEKGTVNIIKEVKLWEVSSLTHWGANENTPTLYVKNANDAIQMLKSLNQILTKTEISDERAAELQKEYEQLSLIIKTLGAGQHSEPKKIDWKLVTNNLNF